MTPDRYLNIGPFEDRHYSISIKLQLRMEELLFIKYYRTVSGCDAMSITVKLASSSKNEFKSIHLINASVEKISAFCYFIIFYTKIIYMFIFQLEELRKFRNNFSDT